MVTMALSCVGLLPLLPLVLLMCYLVPLHISLCTMFPFLLNHLLLSELNVVSLQVARQLALAPARTSSTHVSMLK
jgi:hypothetical protein